MPALIAADELRLFEALDQRPAAAEELAEREQLNPEALKVLLPLLVSLGFAELHEGRCRPTQAARLYLLHDSPLYWGHAFTFYRDTPHAQGLVTALKTRAADVDQFGERPVESWESGAIDPAVARMVCEVMQSHSQPGALGLASLGLFDGVKRLLDVGGGSGCFSIALAARDPALRCTVMELPVMCELTEGYIRSADLGGRVDALPRDMFRQAWPEGYDAIFMSNVFHDWPQDTCARLAALAYGALPSGGRICLHEMLMDDAGAGPLPAAAFAMLMLVGTKGRQYSGAELTAILAEAGFVDIQVRPAYGYFSLITGFKG
jgi:acetylserotonin N-methyltransferase